MTIFKTLTGLLALLLLIAFLLPPAIKLHKISLAAVVLIGIGMAAYEFYESVRNKRD